MLPRAPARVFARSPLTSATGPRSTRTGASPRKRARGLGITALFAGRAAPARRWPPRCSPASSRLDLYRIDLARSSASTSARPRRTSDALFDAAEEGGAILLFDEADALFGKRSEVKDSHDRYANIEVSYLLQRMEAYRGLAILTTNLRTPRPRVPAPAPLRRRFPFPDAAQRAEIWRRVFPRDAAEGDRRRALARLNVAGGNIRNIALGAAFLAAEAGAGRHGALAQAARRVREARAAAHRGGDAGVDVMRLEVTIDDLVLDEFDPAERQLVADAVERELTAMSLPGRGGRPWAGLEHRAVQAREGSPEAIGRAVRHSIGAALASRLIR